jgi:segregation and condensation protein B
MSLKAKLEAAIYAAEEPVTLAQLSALFAADALEWKAAQEAASAAAAAEQAPPAGEPLPLLNAAFDYLELEQATQGPAETAEAPLKAASDGDVEARGDAAEEAAEAGEGADASKDGGAEDGVEATGGAGSESSPETQADSEDEAKRLARLRDREARSILRELLEETIASYASDDRGIEIKEIAGGYRMATKPECHDAARMFVKSLKPALKLSLPALETLAVIAYKQPVTAPEVNEIRGVDSSGVFGSLLARKLIATAGRKQVIGRPILYKTTREFLLRFGLKDVSELPSMEEFEKIAQLEFDEMESTSEGKSTAAENEDLSLEVDEDLDEAIEEAAADAAQETEEAPQQESQGTAAMADSEEAPAAQAPEANEPRAAIAAIEAEPTPAEATPAAPSSPAEQAETETVPHDR